MITFLFLSALYFVFFFMRSIFHYGIELISLIGLIGFSLLALIIFLYAGAREEIFATIRLIREFVAKFRG